MINNNINSEYINKTIALAGIFQAAALVKQLAWTSKCDIEALETSINSILQIDSPSVLKVYGGELSKLSVGLRSLITFFGNPNNSLKDTEIARYVFSLLYLENKLSKRSDLLAIIKSGIIRAKMQADLFTVTHDNVIANLAGIYIDTLSTFTFRIHITGNQSYLTNPVVTNKTRALLLAGIRSAVLWKQLGGSRLQIFFKKNTFIKCAQQLYQSITPQEVDAK